MEQAFKNSAALLREKLGSIEKLEPDKLLSPREARAKAATIETFYRNYFKGELQRFINEQLLFMGTQTKNASQFLFGRGTINGFLLIKDWFKKQIALAQSKPSKKLKTKPEAPFALGE